MMVNMRFLVNHAWAAAKDQGTIKLFFSGKVWRYKHSHFKRYCHFSAFVGSYRGRAQSGLYVPKNFQSGFATFQKILDIFTLK